jgi:hypothetical protein
MEILRPQSNKPMNPLGDARIHAPACWFSRLFPSDSRSRLSRLEHFHVSWNMKMLQIVVFTRFLNANRLA